jgi:dTDP-4-amino-4,6-dideoxygalactose transaminase
MTLAVNGGTPVRTEKFPPHKFIGDEEKKAVAEVLDSGILSKFLGCWHDDFFGGPQVQALEKKWAEYFNVKHAVSVNSCTSGLYCAVGAAGISPGDEVIVSPYTMSASATAALIYGGIPVFADIEEEYYCLDPDSIEKLITPKTKAIIVVDLLGLPYDVERINAIAEKHNLTIIEDCAQAPGAKYNNKFAGTLGDMGVYSLNYHKHIHCGEGGVIVTDDDELANKLRLIRNHAEAVAGGTELTDYVNMVGFNYRMTEIEAAIAGCQLDKLKDLIAERQKNCAYLEAGLKDIPVLKMPAVRENCTHSYYVHALQYDEIPGEVSRNKFVEAIQAELPVTELREAEGPLISYGYGQPLYLLPMYQKRIAFGKDGYPFTLTDRTYEKGLCPVTEKMFDKLFIGHELMRPGMTKKDLDDVIEAFYKVWENRSQL